MKSLLCVGGPMHGKMVSLDHDKHEYVVVANHEMYPLIADGSLDTEQVDVTKYIYTNEKLEVPFGDNKRALVCRRIK